MVRSHSDYLFFNQFVTPSTIIFVTEGSWGPGPPFFPLWINLKDFTLTGRGKHSWLLHLIQKIWVVWTQSGQRPHPFILSCFYFIFYFQPYFLFFTSLNCLVVEKHSWGLNLYLAAGSFLDSALSISKSFYNLQLLAAGGTLFPGQGLSLTHTVSVSLSLCESLFSPSPSHLLGGRAVGVMTKPRLAMC